MQCLSYSYRWHNMCGNDVYDGIWYTLTFTHIWLSHYSMGLIHCNPSFLIFNRKCGLRILQTRAWIFLFTYVFLFLNYKNVLDHIITIMWTCYRIECKEWLVALRSSKKFKLLLTFWTNKNYLLVIRA